MKITCGGLIHYNRKLLICRPRWDSELWNLPKGTMEPDETFIETATREIKEETGIVIDDTCEVIDLGTTSYTKKKIIHLFHIVLSKDPGELICNSFFERDGKQIPEMVDFKWIDFSDYPLYFSEKLSMSVKLLNKGMKNVHRINKESSGRDPKNIR